MKKSLAHGVAILIAVAALQACGVGGGSGPDGSGNPPDPTPTSGNAGSTTDSGSPTGGDPAAGTGSTGATGSGTSGGTSTTGGAGGTTTTPAPPPIELPNKLTINLPFTCPADQNSIIGCWVSEVCEQGASTNTSYRNVLMFDATTGVDLHNMYVHWGFSGCPSDETPSGVTQDSTKDFVYYGAVGVQTTTEGMVGYLLDVDQGNTKTVVGEILQLRQYGVQRMCFVENHYNPATGLVSTAQRSSEEPYVIDNTKCLQRHLD